VQAETELYEFQERECEKLKQEKEEWIMKKNELKNAIYLLEREIDE
jgi:hypothetical protein